MKKLILMITTFLLLFTISGCGGSTIEGYDGLIEKARKEISLADIENMDIQIAGTTDVDGYSLVWFVTGNEYQKHSYYPMEFQIVGENSNKFKFVKAYMARDRGQDIAAYPWNGYTFVINNQDCLKMVLTYEDGTTEEFEITDSLPTVRSTSITPKSYAFFDVYGNEIR
jgi:hypothetical protein